MGALAFLFHCLFEPSVICPEGFALQCAYAAVRAFFIAPNCIYNIALCFGVRSSGCNSSSVLKGLKYMGTLCLLKIL